MCVVLILIIRLNEGRKLNAHFYLFNYDINSVKFCKPDLTQHDSFEPVKLVYNWKIMTKTRHDWVGQGDPLWKKFKIDEQMVCVQSRIHPGKWDAQNSLGFWDTNGSFNLGQTTRPSDGQKKKKRENLPNCRLCCPGWSQAKTERKRKER